MTQRRVVSSPLEHSDCPPAFRPPSNTLQDPPRFFSLRSLLSFPQRLLRPRQRIEREMGVVSLSSIGASRGADPGPPPNDGDGSPGPSVKPSPRNGKVRDMRGSDPHVYDQLGLLRQPSGTEPAAEHRRRIDTNEAALASHLLRIKDGMATEAKKRDEQHALVCITRPFLCPY